MSRAGTSIACVILGGRTPCYQRRRILVNGDRGVPAILAVVGVLAFGTCVRIRCAIVLLAASASATPTTPVTSASTLRLFASVLAATLWCWLCNRVPACFVLGCRIRVVGVLVAASIAVTTFVVVTLFLRASFAVLTTAITTLDVALFVSLLFVPFLIAVLAFAVTAFAVATIRLALIVFVVATTGFVTPSFVAAPVFVAFVAIVFTVSGLAVFLAPIAAFAGLLAMILTIAASVVPATLSTTVVVTPTIGAYWLVPFFGRCGTTAKQSCPEAPQNTFRWGLCNLRRF